MNCGELTHTHILAKNNLLLTEIKLKKKRSFKLNIRIFICDKFKAKCTIRLTFSFHVLCIHTYTQHKAYALKYYIGTLFLHIFFSQSYKNTDTHKPF